MDYSINRPILGDVLNLTGPDADADYRITVDDGSRESFTWLTRHDLIDLRDAINAELEAK